MHSPPSGAEVAEPRSNGLDVTGRVAVLETRLSQQAETNARVEQEIQRLRDFRHAATNIVTGWAEFERGVDALAQSVRELQAEVRELRKANDKLMGPGGAIEQLAQLAEDRRFKRRLLGWAAWLSGGIATAWAFAQAVWPYVKLPPKP